MSYLSIVFRSIGAIRLGLCLIMAVGLACASEGQVFQGNPQHTGLSSAAGPTQFNRVKWQFKTDGRVFSSPIIANGLLYIGSADSRLYALEAATGKEKWRFQTGGAVNSTPAVANGLVYFLSADGHCYAVEAAIGAVRWQFATRGEKIYDVWDYYLSSPVVVGDTVYFGSGDGFLYALDAKTGAKQWEFETGGIVHAPPVVADGIVYIGSFDGRFYAIEAETGKLKWQFKTVGERWFPVGEVQGGASVAGGMVFFGSRDYNIYALDAKTGTGRWNDKIPNTWVIATPAVKDGVIYFGTSDGRSFLAYDIESGQKKWVLPVALNVFSSAALTADAIYFGSFDGRLHAVDLTTGRERWQFRTAASIANSGSVLNEKGECREDIAAFFHEDYKAMYEAIIGLGAILSSPAVADGVVFFGSADGNVYAVE